MPTNSSIDEYKIGAQKDASPADQCPHIGQYNEGGNTAQDGAHKQTAAGVPLRVASQGRQPHETCGHRHPSYCSHVLQQYHVDGGVWSSKHWNNSIKLLTGTYFRLVTSAPYGYGLISGDAVWMIILGRKINEH